MSLLWIEKHLKKVGSVFFNGEVTLTCVEGSAVDYPSNPVSNEKMQIVSRRKFILTAGATSVSSFLFHGCGTKSPINTPSPTLLKATGNSPEINTATLGFIASLDCAPLVIAFEKGFFAKHGMTNVRLQQQDSWSIIRDDLELGGEKGGVDGAHAPTPIPYLLSAGKISKGKAPVPMGILARLNTNGPGICLAKDYQTLSSGLNAQLLQPRITEMRGTGKKFNCAVTSLGGTHDLWLRYWLAANGINPISDVSIMVLPSQQIITAMKDKTVDVCCVDEPFLTQLMSQDIGSTLATTGELWKNHPEKAFTMRSDWINRHPRATKSLMMAVMEAQMWCDKTENQLELEKIITSAPYRVTSGEGILHQLQGQFNFANNRSFKNEELRIKFWEGFSSFPFKSHDSWFIAENIRWGNLVEADLELVDQVNRSDLWIEAAKAIGEERLIPPDPLSRGVETFFDGLNFDSTNPSDYLNQLVIKKV